MSNPRWGTCSHIDRKSANLPAEDWESRPCVSGRARVFPHNEKIRKIDPAPAYGEEAATSGEQVNYAPSDPFRTTMSWPTAVLCNIFSRDRASMSTINASTLLLAPPCAVLLTRSI